MIADSIVAVLSGNVVASYTDIYITVTIVSEKSIMHQNHIHLHMICTKYKRD